MSNKTLIQIVNDRRALDDILTEIDGEISDDKVEQITSQWMAEIKNDLVNKSDGYNFRMKDMESMQIQFKEFETMYRNARKSLERVETSLKERMKFAMNEMGITELQGNQFKYKLSPSAPSCEIIDESQLPAIFCREKVVLTVDKDAVKKHVLESGEEIPGVRINRGQTLRVSIVKEKKNETK